MAFVLADTSVVKAVFGVSDITMEHLKLGQQLTITTEAMPGVRFHGQVTKIEPSADATSRMFQIEIKVPNSDNRLKPGMIAVVALPGDRDSTPALTVPLSAVVRTPGTAEYTVYVVEEQEGRTLARRRFVRLGPVLGNRVVVTEGVARGEVVVVKGTTQIVDGERIRVLAEAG